MILTITMNPAIDKSSTIDKMIPDKKLRCAAPALEAGGGGINVSKAISKLGGSSLAVFPAGGYNGALLERMLLANHIRYASIPVDAETREDFSVTEQATQSQFRFVMPGSRLSAMEVRQCLNIIEPHCAGADIIVASGSLPPGVPEDVFARIAVFARQYGARFIVDTSGVPLELAVKEGVFLVKPNLSELCSLVGKDSLQLEEVAEAARQVIKNGGCKVLVVSLGSSGALLVTENILESIPAPPVKRNSTIGAGDSMVGGMAWMLESGATLSEMARFGVACGTAATMRAGTQLFDKEDVFRLYKWLNARHPALKSIY